MKIKSICGVIIASDNPAALADFYGRVFDVCFERETHGGLEAHFGADIGQIHLGIHPPENLRMSSGGRSSISIAYNVDSLMDVIDRLSALQADQVLPPHDEGFGRMATYRDPEGNQFEIVELDYKFSEA